MKIFLTILVAIIGFLLFLLLILLPSRLIFNVRFDGNVKFTVRLLFVKYELPVPVFYRPKISEESKKVKKQVIEEDTKQKRKKKEKKQKEKLPFPGIKNALVFIKESLGVFGKALKNSFRLERMDFRAIAGSEDASTTAELYGALCIVGSSLHQFATLSKGMKDKNVHVEIIPDFLAQKPDIFADIRFSIRVFRLLLLGNAGYSIFNNYKTLARETALKKDAEKDEVKASTTLKK